MRIDTLRLKNFKKFADVEYSLHPQFTLLVGENGSGKTSILDALAVALGVWLIEPPDSTLWYSGRNILKKEIRLESSQRGDRTSFTEYSPVVVSATGKIGAVESLTWSREMVMGRANNNKSKEALNVVKDIYERDQAGEKVLCPIIAYYGAGRAWLPSNTRAKEKTKGPARRWDAFYDCLSERIRLVDLQQWFFKERIHRDYPRPGFRIVCQAIIDCIPKADDIWYDPDREQVVLSINKEAQPFDNLSAGQRMMLALVADIAIKAVTQNTYLVPPSGQEAEGEELARVLCETPGVVLIDELDLHLHPRWQRSVVGDLKRTFPALQFVCTTHSPQIIGEVNPEEIRLLDRDFEPNQSFGMDSNWILQALMGTPKRDPITDAELDKIFSLIAHKEIEEAKKRVSALRKSAGNSQDLQRASSIIKRIELIGR